MILKKNNIVVLLFVFAFSAVFFGQVTYGSGVRISMPFRFIEIMLFFVLIAFILLSSHKIKIDLPSFMITLYITMVTLVSLYIYAFLEISGYYYIQISLYVYLHAMVIFYITTYYRNGELQNRLANISFYLLILNSYLAIFFYISHLIGLNHIEFGINYFYSTSNIPRAMGLSAEPSIYSIISWIILYMSYTINKKINFQNVLLLIAFVISFSTTGIVFALLSLFLYIVYNIKLKSLLLSIIFTIILIILIPDEYTSRYMTRMYGELLILYNFFIVGSDYISLRSINAGMSRSINFIYQISIITSDGIKHLIGTGSGGQVIEQAVLGERFRSLLYVLVEYGVIGLSLVSYIIFRMYGMLKKNTRPLFVAYLLISLFNPSGGNFGTDFIFILFVIFLISQLSKDSYYFRYNIVAH